MNKHELSEKVAARISGTSKKQVEDIINVMLEIVTDTLIADGEVTFTGFGTFMAKHRVGRMGVNPQNPGQKIKIPPITVPKFKAGKALKDALKSSGGTHSESDAQATPTETPATPPATPAAPDSATDDSTNTGSSM